MHVLPLVRLSGHVTPTTTRITGTYVFVEPDMNAFVTALVGSFTSAEASPPPT